MTYSFRRTCYNCKNRRDSCQKGCEQKLADDFFYYSYQKQENERKLVQNHCGSRYYKDKLIKANSKNNNHWLDIN